MNVFRSYTMAWWQIGIMKLSLLLFGAVIGAYWYPFFLENMTVVLIVAIVSGLYAVYAAFSQGK